MKRREFVKAAALAPASAILAMDGPAEAVTTAKSAPTGKTKAIKVAAKTERSKSADVAG